MNRSILAIGVISIASFSIFAAPTTGQNNPIKFTDVDGNELSTGDGRINILVLTSKANIDKARAVGDRTPDFCLANPAYRMITVVAFDKHSSPVRAMLSSIMRRRLDGEGRKLQARYDQLKIMRNARQDVFAAADFDGAIATQLGSKWEANLFSVFVFGKNGDLLKRWDDLPRAEDLAAVLKRD